MPQARIIINGTPGSDDDLPINTIVQLDNQDIGGETAYLWSILDQPPGPDDLLSATNIKNPTFTPKKEGSYLIQLVVNFSLPDEQQDRAIAGIRQVKSRERIPAAGETNESDTSDGWATAMNALLRKLDILIGDTGWIVGVNASGGTLVKGDIVRVTTGSIIKSGLPGQETVPGFTKAPASTLGNLDELLCCVISDVDGNPSVGNGLMCRVRYVGRMDSITLGGGVVGDMVFVSDTATLSLTPGTYRRRAGSVMNLIGGGVCDVWFDGVGGEDITPIDRAYVLYGAPSAGMANAHRIDGNNANGAIGGIPHMFKAGDAVTQALVARAFAGMTANITEVQNAAGAMVARIRADGTFENVAGNSSNAAIRGQSSGGGYGVEGVGSGIDVGVRGSSSGAAGVYGSCANVNAGVVGVNSSSGPGVAGINTKVGAGAGPGVRGTGGTAQPGVTGIGGATSGEGVQGTGTGTGIGVHGSATSGEGVVGESTGSFGVRGQGGGGYPGVSGTGGAGGTGVSGLGGSGDATGVQGTGSGVNPGVQGTGSAAVGGSIGVVGIATGGTGKAGVYGVGSGSAGPGVEGLGSGTSPGVKGTGGGSGVEGYGAGTSAGVYGEGTGGGIGVLGQGVGSGNSGVKGIGGTNGPGVYGLSVAGFGVRAESAVTTPTRAPLYVVPQTSLPSTFDSGAITVLAPAKQIFLGDGSRFVALKHKLSWLDTPQVYFAPTAANTEEEVPETLVTIPANTCRPGSVLRVFSRSAIVIGGTRTWLFRIRLGSNANPSLRESIASITRSAAAGAAFIQEVWATIQTAGLTASALNFYSTAPDFTPTFLGTVVFNAAVTNYLSFTAQTNNITGPPQITIQQFESFISG